MNSITSFSYYLPRGRAWNGKNLKKLVEAINIVILEYFTKPSIEYRKEFFLSNSSSITNRMLFNELNINNQLFEDYLSDEEVLKVLKIFALPKNYVSRNDIVEIMNSLGYEIEFLNALDVYNNPDNYTNLSYIPKTEEESYYILYYKLNFQGGSKELTFPIFFDIVFTNNTTKDIANKLLEKIVDAHIMLVNYE